MPASNIDVILRLLNSRRFQAETAASARSIHAMTGALEEAQVASSGLAAAQKTLAGGMFLIGGATRLVGKSLLIAAGAATITGLKFNATMESNTLAFEKFTGSAANAHKLLNSLFETAANTPFTFADITTATKRLMAFGFNAKEAASWMKTLGDTISYTGGSADDIMRAVKAIGEIKGIGRLQQRQILQLTNLGVNAHDILTKNLHLTESQLHNIGRAGIGAQEALSALQSGFNKKFGGGAEKYSRTLVGRLEKAKDYAERAFGAVTKPLYNALRDKALPWIIKQFQSLNKWATGDGLKKFSAKWGPKMASVWQGIKKAVGQFMDAIKPMEPFWQNVLWPLIKGFAKGLAGTLVVAFAVVIGAIKVLSIVLGALGKIMKPFRGIIEAIGNVLSWFVGGIVLKGISLLGKFGGVFRLLGGAAKMAYPILKTAGLIFEGIGRAVWFLVKPVLSLIGKIPGLAKAFRYVGALAAKAALHFLAAWGRAITRIPGMLGRLAVTASRFMLKIGIRMGDALVRGLKGVSKKILGVFTTGIAFFHSVGRGIANWLNKNTLFGNEVKLGPVHFRIPKLATGGFLAEGGYAWVGERGPELVRFPTGAQVIPHGPAVAMTGGPRATVPMQPAPRPLKAARPVATAGADGQSGPAFARLIVRNNQPIMIGRKQIGKVVGDFVAEREARS